MSESFGDIDIKQLFFAILNVFFSLVFFFLSRALPAISSCITFWCKATNIYTMPYFFYCSCKLWKILEFSTDLQLLK